MFYTYILRNREDKSLYKGWTSDLKARLKKHQERGTQTTSRGRYDLVWYCAFPTKNQAIRFEKYLKSGSGKAFMKKRFVKKQ